MAEKVLMEDMTWGEIEQAIKDGKNTVLVVAGSIEQHGPHLPTSTDTTLGYAVAERCARKLGNVLVAPVIRPGLSEHHIGFPGSFTVTIDTFISILYEYCESLIKTGFKNICIFSSHGGNTDALTTYIPRIAQRFMGRAMIFTIPPERYLFVDVDYLAKKGVSRAKAGVHAGYSETCMMLYLKPSITRMDLAKKGLANEEFYQPINLWKSQLETFTMGVKKKSPNGVLGDPRGASAEVGKKLIEVTVNSLCKEIRACLRIPKGKK